jgi:gluconate kinase
MLLVFAGPSSTGKSSVAKEIKSRQGNWQVYSGKDYLRFSKNREEAWAKFREEITAAAGSTDKNVIYIITETEFVNDLANIKGVRFMKFVADHDTIKTRFASRTGGNLPQPLAAMLERQVAAWEQVKADYCIDTSAGASVAEIADKVCEAIH